MNVRFSDLLEFFSPFFPVIVGESFQTLAHLHAISLSIARLVANSSAG
jgi:hypothetical protein